MAQSLKLLVKLLYMLLRYRLEGLKMVGTAFKNKKDSMKWTTKSHEEFMSLSKDYRKMLVGDELPEGFADKAFNLHEGMRSGKVAFAKCLSTYARELNFDEAVYAMLCEIDKDPYKVYNTSIKWVVGMLRAHNTCKGIADANVSSMKGIDARNNDAYIHCFNVCKTLYKEGIFGSNEKSDSRVMESIEFNEIDKLCQARLSYLFIIGLFVSSVYVGDGTTTMGIADLYGIGGFYDLYVLLRIADSLK